MFMLFVYIYIYGIFLPHCLSSRDEPISFLAVVCREKRVVFLNQIVGRNDHGGGQVIAVGRFIAGCRGSKFDFSVCL